MNKANLTHAVIKKNSLPKDVSNLATVAKYALLMQWMSGFD